MPDPMIRVRNEAGAFWCGGHAQWQPTDKNVLIFSSVWAAINDTRPAASSHVLHFENFVGGQWIEVEAQ